VNSIATAFSNQGVTVTDGVYPLRVICGAADPVTYPDTPTFGAFIEITGDDWTVKEVAPATQTTVTVAADPAGHSVVSHTFKLTASVTPPGAAGNVEFFSNGGDSPVGSVDPNGGAPVHQKVPVANGTASITVPPVANASYNDYTAIFTPTDPTAFTPARSEQIDYAFVAEQQVTALDKDNNTLDGTPALTAGQQLKLTVDGFLPGKGTGSGESVDLTLDGSAGDLTAATADSKGSVTNYAFTVPDSVKDGSHTLKFHGHTSAIDQTFAFKVGADQTTTGGTTAGSDDGGTDTGGTDNTGGTGTTAGSGDTSGTGTGGSAGADTGGTSAGDSSGGTSGGSAGGTSGGGTGPLAATGADAVIPLSALAVLFAGAGGYAVYRVRRDGKLLSFGPTPRD
jgi:hypothetical protein